MLTLARFLDISFDYNLDLDTPEGVASEMKNELKLKE
jgi:hypothetical protein